jgi:guanine deaminase
MSKRERLKYMERAVKEARKNLARPDGGPFGACIVKGTRVIAVARNTVLTEDASCHAEVNAIRQASKRLRTFDLSGCHIYSTTEPCPMCLAAIHWARIDSVCYGTTIADARRIGFRELSISARAMKKMGKSPLIISSGLMRRECRRLFDDWLRLPARQIY